MYKQLFLWYSTYYRFEYSEGEIDMKKHENAIIETTQIKLIVCNMCTTDIDVTSAPYIDRHISIEKEWCYGSPYDGDRHTIDLCSLCYDKLVQTLKIAPHM